MKKAYIILLNYHRIKDTLECLESLLKLEYQNFQVFVVDNSNTSDDLAAFKRWAQGEPVEIDTDFEGLVYPLASKPVDFRTVSEDQFSLATCPEKIIFIKANKNGGFAAGNNIALRHIIKYGNKESFIWLLNNDTVAEKQSLGALVSFAEREENAQTGIIGSRLIYYFKPGELQAIGGRFNKAFYISTHEGEGQAFDTPKSEFGPIDYVVGASMFITHRFLTEVGPLSEDYFLYYEELDWTYRAKEKGWNIDWCPDSVVYHKEGASIGSSYREKKSLFSEEQVFRSRKIFTRKFYGLSLKFYLSSMLLIANRLRKGNFKAAMAVTKITFAE